MAESHLRAILAANLRKRINADTPPGAKFSVRAWATGKGLDVRMIDRLVKGQHAVTLDNLDKIAEACGLKAWHLLLDDLDPASTPDAPITEDERAMLRRLRKLLDVSP
ncbi:MAG: hypothetical protein IPL57_12590 [Rubrivivax sp.]|jgi:transcriptional regulator with XRE-family HTH domain|nr:hypothetical protein [Rubrivivax sp.]